MADIFVHTAGSNTSPYDTWAKAATALANVAAVDAASDRILIDSTNSESVATISYTAPGAAATPNQILSCTPSGGAGIGALAAGAVFTTTGTTTIFSGCAYVYGVTIRNSSASSNGITIGQTNGVLQHWDTCSFEHTGAGGSSIIEIGSVTAGGGGRVVLNNCTFKLGATGQRIYVSGEVVIRGGSWLSGGTTPVNIFGCSSSNRGASLLVEGFDFSNLAATVNLMQGQGGTSTVFRDCKLPASWTGVPVTSALIQPGQRVALWNCGNGGTTHRVWVVDYQYTLIAETVVVKTGGAQDDATPISWKMTTTANVAYGSGEGVSPDMLINNTTTGSAKTITVDIIHDSVTNLTDAEVWLQVEYLGTSGQAIGSVITDAKSSVIATAADQTASGATWTTTGLTNPNKQKLEVTLTPQQKGYFICRVCCAKASKTIYIDPKPVVT
jgi:hypothetical protein